jgi:D-arabinose 1-dehydrogenase-like Zn-dependent alcohol dehydrogenase
MEAVRKPLVVKEVPDPKCRRNGVILRAEAEGICRSDWHAWSGDWAWIGLVPAMPLVMGHEFCGVIEEVGNDVHNTAAMASPTSAPIPPSLASLTGAVMAATSASPMPI